MSGYLFSVIICVQSILINLQSIGSSLEVKQLNHIPKIQPSSCPVGACFVSFPLGTIKDFIWTWYIGHKLVNLCLRACPETLPIPFLLVFCPHLFRKCPKYVQTISRWMLAWELSPNFDSHTPSFIN